MALFRRKEKRDNLTKWIAWLDAQGGQPASSGVMVSEDSSMTATAVLACLRVLSTTMAMLPLPLYIRLGNGGKERAFDHPLYSILHDEANNYQTAYEFRQQMMMHALLYGNFYSLIDRNAENGSLSGLLPFPEPNKMEVGLFGQEMGYRYTFSNGKVEKYTQDEIFHVKGMSSDGLMGLVLLDKGRDPIGLALALQTYASKFFESGGNISGILEHPGSLSEDAQKRLKMSWDRAYGGVSNSHKVAILEEGMKFNKIGASPEEAQALESRKFQTLEVARIFGVPPHMIGDLERATFSNIEHQGIEFVTFCLAPWATLIEQRIQKQLLNPVEKKLYFAKFSLEALMRGDYKSRQEGLNIMRQNGIINANEWRALENFNPIEGKPGELYLTNGNMIEVGKEPEQPKEKPDDRALIMLSYRTVFDDALSRILKREESDIMRRSKKPGELKPWLFDFYKEHETFVRKNLEPIYRALSIATNEDCMGKMNEFIRKHIDGSIELMTRAVDERLDLQTVFDTRERGELNA